MRPIAIRDFMRVEIVEDLDTNMNDLGEKGEMKTFDSSKHRTKLPDSHTSDTNTFHCELCGKCFANKYRLDNHYVVHNKARPFVCPICKTAFKRKPELHIHVMRRHIEDTGKKEKQFSCEKCDKKFSTKSSRDGHVQFTHSTLKAFVCECGQTFKRQLYLDKHRGTRSHKIALKEKGNIDFRAADVTKNSVQCNHNKHKDSNNNDVSALQCNSSSHTDQMAPHIDCRMEGEIGEVIQNPLNTFIVKVEMVDDVDETYETEESGIINGPSENFHGTIISTLHGKSPALTTGQVNSNTSETENVKHQEIQVDTTHNSFADLSSKPKIISKSTVQKHSYRKSKSKSATQTNGPKAKQRLLVKINSRKKKDESKSKTDIDPGKRNNSSKIFKKDKKVNFDHSSLTVAKGSNEMPNVDVCKSVCKQCNLYFKNSYMLRLHRKEAHQLKSEVYTNNFGDQWSDGVNLIDIHQSLDNDIKTKNITI